MKKFLIVLSIMVLLGTVALCYAQPQTYNIGFSWDASTELDLAGYRFYSSQTSGSYTFGDPNHYTPIDPNSTTYLLQGVAGFETFFVLTAYDIAGNESPPSNEVKFDPIAPAAPSNFKIDVVIHVH